MPFNAEKALNESAVEWKTFTKRQTKRNVNAYVMYTLLHIQFDITFPLFLYICSPQLQTGSNILSCDLKAT